MSDTHNREARDHLLRIQRRVAEDAVLLQRALSDRLANTPLRDLGQRILEATVAHQSEPDPNCEIVLAAVARGVDSACRELGFDLQKGIVRGVLPARGLGAFTGDFYGTGVAIIGIDASLIPFTGMLTDLFAETFEYRETADGLAVVADVAACMQRITGGKTIVESSDEARAGREMLIHHWERFFLHFAGLSLAWPQPTLTEAQRALKFQLTSAMEVFVLGHEYGHHIKGHNTGSSAASSLPPEESHVLEFEADQTAFLIAKYLGATGFAGRPTNVRNTWMEGSAGAVAYLVAAEVVRRVRQILETGTEEAQLSVSHPSTSDRLFALEDWEGFAGHPLRDDFYQQRRFLGLLIHTIYEYLKPKFLAAHRAGYRPAHL